MLQFLLLQFLMMLQFLLLQFSDDVRLYYSCIYHFGWCFCGFFFFLSLLLCCCSVVVDPVSLFSLILLILFTKSYCIILLLPVADAWITDASCWFQCFWLQLLLHICLLVLFALLLLLLLLLGPFICVGSMLGYLCQPTKQAFSIIIHKDKPG